MFDPASVRISGPLEPYVEGFWADLERQGYSPLSGAELLRLAAQFSRWLEDHGLGVGDLRERHVVSFTTYRRRRGYSASITPRALEPLLGHLRSVGVEIRSEPIVETPLDQVLREYTEYLARERGLCATSIRGYTDHARAFAKSQFDTGRPNWNQLTPEDVVGFVTHESRRWSIGHCKMKVTCLRSLLRFLHVRGHIARDLVGCVPAVAGWRLAWLPKALDQDQINRLLKLPTPRSPKDLRDAAIVRLLVRLGLRAGDVAALELDDINWRTGTLTVGGKGGYESQLPLPHDVGQKMAAYLRRGRPRATTRKLFLRTRAPHRELSSGGVLAATRSVLRQAGIVTGGAHVLRHTAATQMLRHGASLSEIGHVLRHRHVDTTAIYAKVDHTKLRGLAQPWPEEGA